MKKPWVLTFSQTLKLKLRKPLNISVKKLKSVFKSYSKEAFSVLLLNLGYPCKGEGGNTKFSIAIFFLITPKLAEKQAI